MALGCSGVDAPWGWGFHKKSTLRATESIGPQSVLYDESKGHSDLGGPAKRRLDSTAADIGRLPATTT